MNKDDVLLTNEEIEDIQDLGDSKMSNFTEYWMHEDALERIAQAQLKKLVELLDNYNLSEKEGSGYKLIPFYIWESVKEIAGVK